MWVFSLVGVGVIGVVVGLVCLVSQRKSLFGALLSLEIFTLMVYMVLFSIFYSFSMFISICLVFLTFGVCEAALGLSLLVALVRSTGSDYVGGLVSGHFSLLVVGIFISVVCLVSVNIFWWSSVYWCLCVSVVGFELWFSLLIKKDIFEYFDG